MGTWKSFSHDVNQSHFLMMGTWIQVTFSWWELQSYFLMMGTSKLGSNDGNIYFFMMGTWSSHHEKVIVFACFYSSTVHDFVCSLYSLHELSDKLLLLAEVMEEIFRRNQRIFSTVSVNKDRQIWLVSAVWCSVCVQLWSFLWHGLALPSPLPIP